VTTRGSRWQTEQKRAAGQRVKIRIDRYEIRDAGRGTYEVVVEGHGLHAAVVPPQVTVGGVPVEELRLEPQGRVLRGILRKKPQSRKVVVDYGFARAETT